MTDQKPSMREMMALFRKRNSMIDGFLSNSREAMKTNFKPLHELGFSQLAAVNKSVFDMTASHRDLSVKFVELWRRTYWAEMVRELTLEQHVLLEIVPPVAQLLMTSQPLYSIDQQVVVYDAPPLPLAQLAQCDSLDDFTMINQAPATACFLLCRALSKTAVRAGLIFIAEDRRGNTFWVHSLTTPLAFRPPQCPNVGDVFALRFPYLSVMPETWEARLRLPHEGALEAIEDESAEVLADTPWYVAPCASAFEWKERGNALFGAGRFAQARAAYSRGLQLDETHVDLLSNRAAALIKLCNWHEALRDADAVLARDAAHRKCAMRRAAALMKLERYREAVDAWMSAAVMNRDIPDEMTACTASATRALAAQQQTEGKFDWAALMALVEKCQAFEVGTYVHPALHFSPSTLGNRGAGLCAKEALASGTLVVVESPLVRVDSTQLPRECVKLALCDAAIGMHSGDSFRRQQIDQLIAAPHIKGATVHERIKSMCQTATNFFDDATTDQRRLNGVGVCFVSSRINHSCEPNCVLTTFGHMAVVQTIADVPRGAELTLAFCRPDTSLSERRSELADLNIECKCRRCVLESTDETMRAIGIRVAKLHKALTTAPAVGNLTTRDIEELKRDIMAHPEARLAWFARVCFGAMGVQPFKPDDGQRLTNCKRAFNEATVTNKVNFFEIFLFFKHLDGGVAQDAARERLCIGLPRALADHVKSSL
jgi:tetratricopeptide (TPR) repeat protein